MSNLCAYKEVLLKRAGDDYSEIFVPFAITKPSDDKTPFFTIYSTKLIENFPIVFKKVFQLNHNSLPSERLVTVHKSHSSIEDFNKSTIIITQDPQLNLKHLDESFRITEDYFSGVSTFSVGNYKPFIDMQGVEHLKDETIMFGHGENFERNITRNFNDIFKDFEIKEHHFNIFKNLFKNSKTGDSNQSVNVVGMIIVEIPKEKDDDEEKDYMLILKNPSIPIDEFFFEMANFKGSDKAVMLKNDFKLYANDVKVFRIMKRMLHDIFKQLHLPMTRCNRRHRRTRRRSSVTTTPEC